MMALFSPDSKFMRFMSRIGDLMILNLLYLLTCVPIFTVGAATAALYTVSFRFDTDRESGVIRTYLDAFKANFRQATGLWLVLLLCLVTAFINTLFCYRMPGALHYLAYFFGVLFVLAGLILSYAFPLLSQFDNTGKAIFQNALVLSVGYLPRSLVILAINALPWFLLLTNILLFFRAGFLWFILYFAAGAYVNTRILRKVFAPYLTEEGSV